MERDRALELIIAGGLVAIGCAAGAPVTSLVNAIGGVGGNWAADLAINGYRTWSDAWLTPRGALNNDLRKALARAFRTTFRNLHQDYLRSQAYKRLARRDKDAADLAQEQLLLLPDEIDTLFAKPDALALIVKNQAQSLVVGADREDSSAEAARRQLQRGLKKWLEGHDPDLIVFVTAYVTPERMDELAVRFFEELKTNTREGTAAWRAWQLLEAQSYGQALRSLNVQAEEIAGALTWLQEWTRRLQTLPSTDVEPTGLALLPDSVAGLRQQMQEGHERLGKAIAALPEQIRRIFREELLSFSQPVRLVPTPPPAPRLFGRDTFLAELSAILIEDDPRPLALWGPPGVGKTALALGLINRPELAQTFPHGLAWVALGPEPDMMALLADLVRQFGGNAEGLNTPGERADLLRNWTASRCFLLVIDDVWRQADAALLLNAVRPPARVVFTTRSEQLAEDLKAKVVDVRTLPAKHAVAMLADAGRYAQQAVEAEPDTAEALAVTDLGGLPLALHVAGRRLNSLVRSNGKDGAVSRLREEMTQALLHWRAAAPRPGLEEEHPELLAILDLSYNALPDEAARQAFRKLAVFGPQPLDFDAPAMAAVWDVEETEGERLRDELLAAGLLERSLTPGRFSLHQVLAAWAMALLAATPEEETAAALAHARHYQPIVANWDDAIKRGEMTYSAPREWEQVTRAWDWLARQRDHDSAKALLDHARHWRNVIYNNHDPRRESWLAAAYRAAEQVGDRLGQANVLQAQGQMAAAHAQFEAALELLEQARSLYAAIHAQSGLANVDILMAQMAAAQGNLAAAIEHLQPAAEFAARIGHPLYEQLQAQIDAWRAQLDETQRSGS